LYSAITGSAQKFVADNLAPKYYNFPDLQKRNCEKCCVRHQN